MQDLCIIHIYSPCLIKDKLKWYLLFFFSKWKRVYFIIFVTIMFKPSIDVFFKFGPRR